MLKVSLDLLNVLDPIKQETAVIGSNTSTSSRSAQLYECHTGFLRIPKRSVIEHFCCFCLDYFRALFWSQYDLSIQMVS